MEKWGGGGGAALDQVYRIIVKIFQASQVSILRLLARKIIETTTGSLFRHPYLPLGGIFLQMQALPNSKYYSNYINSIASLLGGISLQCRHFLIVSINFSFELSLTSTGCSCLLDLSITNNLKC